jgi:hypothetical protein
MAARDRLSNFIDQRGRTATILRDAGNITEKYAVARMNPNIKGGVGMALDSYQEEFFRWDSQIRNGDIFQDGLNEERHLVLSVQKVGVDGQHDGLKVSSCRSNDSVVLYQISTGVPDGYGKSIYSLVVKLNDYVHVAHAVRGDSLTQVGEMVMKDVSIIFSGRKLAGYVPKPGDRCVLTNGDKFQVDALDNHIFPGCYRTLCTLDQRL